MPAFNKMFRGLFEDDDRPVRTTVPKQSSPLRPAAAVAAAAPQLDAAEVLRSWAAADPVQRALEGGLTWGEACDIGNDAYYQVLGAKYVEWHRARAQAEAAGGGGAAPAAAPAPAPAPCGELEECRYFNTPRGCREGDDCDYLHIKRSLSELRCRFLDTPRGCNPGFGRRCPYKH